LAGILRVGRQSQERNEYGGGGDQSLPKPHRVIPFHSSPPGDEIGLDYSLQVRGEISTTPKAPREPTSEMTLAVRGEQTSACARGTLSDEAGALPASITIAIVANILVVRMGSPKRPKGNFRPSAYSPNGEQVVTTYIDRRAKALLRLYFSF